MGIVTYLLHTRTYHARFSLQGSPVFNNHSLILKDENVMTCFILLSG